LPHHDKYFLILFIPLFTQAHDTDAHSEATEGDEQPKEHEKGPELPFGGAFDHRADTPKIETQNHPADNETNHRPIKQMGHQELESMFFKVLQAGQTLSPSMGSPPKSLTN